MVLHQARVIESRHGTRTTTLCGRMNGRSKDGMNIAGDGETVTCKFCLRLLPKRAGGASRFVLVPADLLIDVRRLLVGRAARGNADAASVLARLGGAA